MKPPLSDHDLRRKSLRYRKRVLHWIHQAGAGHTGGSLSSVDILNVLYNRILRITPETRLEPGRDRYIQSKGHSVESLFVVLADCGFFDEKELAGLCAYQSHFVGHPTKKIPGVEQNTGALGHGLPLAVGTALGAKMDGADYRVFTLLGDGELAEGSNWEAAMAGAHYHLDNLTAIIDCNTLQITGRTHHVMNNEPLDKKWEAFGWAVRRIDGHDFAALTAALAKPLEPGKPSAIIAMTTKGKGVSFIEDNGVWHHKVPTDAELAQAYAEIDAQLRELEEVSA